MFVNYLQSASQSAGTEREYRNPDREVSGSFLDRQLGHSKLKEKRMSTTINNSLIYTSNLAIPVLYPKGPEEAPEELKL